MSYEKDGSGSEKKPEARVVRKELSIRALIDEAVDFFAVSPDNKPAIAAVTKIQLYLIMSARQQAKLISLLRSLGALEDKGEEMMNDSLVSSTQEVSETVAASLNMPLELAKMIHIFVVRFVLRYEAETEAEANDAIKAAMESTKKGD